MPPLSVSILHRIIKAGNEYNRERLLERIPGRHGSVEVQILAAALDGRSSVVITCEEDSESLFYLHNDAYNLMSLGFDVIWVEGEYRMTVRW